MIYIHKKLMAQSVRKLKATPNLLFKWIKLVYEAEMDKNDHCTFELPDKDNLTAQLAVICNGSPKLRALLRMIAELVVLFHRKVAIWCSLPAHQLLIWAILNALRIDAGCYTAELPQAKRQNLVNAFTSDPDGCHVFIGGFTIGSTGLNLQEMSNHGIAFDAAANRCQDDQVVGRQQRVGGKKTVEFFEMSVDNTFQSTLISKALAKAIPGALAELTLNVNEAEEPIFDDDGEVNLSIDEWFLIGSELIQRPDPRIEEKRLEPLSPEDLVHAILDLKRGQEEEDANSLLWMIEDFDSMAIFDSLFDSC